MRKETVRLSRSQLYEQVWTVSITQLSKKYGLSDVGLAKICKRYNIPRPPRGYWARQAAGYNVKRSQLPEGKNMTIEITPSDQSVSGYKRKDFEARRPPSRKIHNEPIDVPERLSSPHPLIQQSSEILNALQPDKLGLVHPPKKGCLDIQVSKGSLRRALRIMDTVIKALEAKGNKVYLSDGRTKTKILEVPINFGITEKVVTKKKRPEDHDLKGEYQFGHSLLIEERVPSGELNLNIHEDQDFYIHGCQKNWSDVKKSRVENRINSFMDGLMTVAVSKIERDREKEEEEHRRIERQRQMEEERQRRAEFRKRYLEEDARVKKLTSEAESWKRSKTLREYLSEIERHAANGDLPLSLIKKPLEGWLRWAHEQSDRLDPLTPSPPSILDEKCPEEEKRDEYHFSRW